MGEKRFGGPQVGSGPKVDPSRRSWVRSVRIAPLFRPGEAADLKRIAEGWGVPVATAVWAIVHDQLSRCRGREPEYGEAGITIATALQVLRLQRAPVAEAAGPNGGAEA